MKTISRAESCGKGDLASTSGALPSPGLITQSRTLSMSVSLFWDEKVVKGEDVYSILSGPKGRGPQRKWSPHSESVLVYETSARTGGTKSNKKLLLPSTILEPRR